MNVLVRAERTPALIDERVNVIVHAVELECIDRQAVDASVGKVLWRARVQGLTLFLFGNPLTRMIVSSGVLSPPPYIMREGGRHCLKIIFVRVGPRRRVEHRLEPGADAVVVRAESPVQKVAGLHSWPRVTVPEGPVPAQSH